MLRDVYWRQYPVDLLSDDKMACVEAELPADLKYAPYMFYCAALKLCDNDGVFDLEDGVIMARLMRVDNTDIVFKIANLMRKRKIIYRLFDDSMLCGLVDWTYSDKKPRTIEERRRAVAEAIKQKQATASSSRDFMTAPQQQQTAPEFTAPEFTAPKAAAPAQEAQTAPAPQDFSCVENDKNANNVVKSEMDDKNAKNVVTLQDNTVHDNKTVQTYIQDIQTNTHTQQLSGCGQLESPPPDNCQDKNAVGEKNIQNLNTDNANIPTADLSCGGEDISSLAAQALQEAQKDVEETEQANLKGYLNEFFVKNCYGYEKNQSANAINKLAGKILELSDDVNPPGEVASVLCSEFKKLCEGQREEYWKGTPLLPAYMIKPRIMAEIVQYAGKILATNQNNNKFIAAAKKAQEECEAEGDIVTVALQEEYLKYNIDPGDPNAQMLLLQAKSAEQKAQKAKEDTEADTLPPGIDIF